MKDLWEANYQILSIMLLKELIELNVKKCETYGIKHKNCKWFIECTNFKDKVIKRKCLCYNKNFKKRLMNSCIYIY